MVHHTPAVEASITHRASGQPTTCFVWGQMFVSEENRWLPKTAVGGGGERNGWNHGLGSGLNLKSGT